ncbi:hypothetical protein CHUUTOTORO_01670 [Serratia phage vB_SmaM-ChuuTotoro]|nr:hypothetical protein CHUUTOTORO_01670 [Serratia phage vB_SmaM-ChuuTotoro]
MGANRRNDLGQSRRFAPCHLLTLPERQSEEFANRHSTQLYLALLARYQETKPNSQNGKAGHTAHMQSINMLKAYLANVDKLLSHNS